MNIQVKVVCAERFNSIIHSGKEKETKIYLYKNQNHFDVINSMKAFLGSCYYCEKSDKPYNNKNKHRCSTRTDVCKLCAKPKYSKEKKNKIKYIVKTVTDTVLTIIVLITTTMFARKFINAKLVIRLN